MVPEEIQIFQLSDDIIRHGIQLEPCQDFRFFFFFPITRFLSDHATVIVDISRTRGYDIKDSQYDSFSFKHGHH